MYLVPLGSLGAPCLYGSQCTAVNSRCTAGFCRCVAGYFYQQRICGRYFSLVLFEIISVMFRLCVFDSPSILEIWQYIETLASLFAKYRVLQYCVVIIIIINIIYSFKNVT